MQDPESHSEHTRRDTQRAASRTFERRSFMAPPRSEIEAQMEKEAYHHKGIANEHFVDEIPQDIPQEAGGLPDGAGGDILYHDGGEWVALSKPSSGAVLRHNGTVPYWEQPVDVCG